MLKVSDLQKIFLEALKEMDSTQRVKKALAQDHWEGRRVVACVGKAAAAMARGVQEAWGNVPDVAWVITKYGHGSAPEGWRFEEAGHPILDRASLAIGAELAGLFRSLRQGDRWWLLVSGGASALVELPHAGLDVQDLQDFFATLLRSGLDIHAMNLLRRHLSQIKGGGLLRMAQGVAGKTLAISDVSQDRPEAIGSGLTVPDPSTFAEALALFEAHHWQDIHPKIAAVLREGAQGRYLDTCKPQEALAWDAPFSILASNTLLCDALQKRFLEAGWPCLRVLGTMDRPVEEVIAILVQQVKDAQETGPRLFCWGGEPTVAVQGTGLGGRMQHLALGLALALQGVKGWCCLASSTDGTDGPSDVAGAWVDDQSLERAISLGIDAAVLWEQCDAHAFHAALGTHWFTGPTGTNLCDVVLLAVGEIDRLFE